MTEPPPVREIRLPAPHPRFRVRVSGAGRQATHPGAAVQIGDDLYEIVSARAENGEWIYRLEPWDPGQVSRVFLPWGEEAEGEFLAGLRRDQIQSGLIALTLGTQAILGFLPAKHQERLAETLRFDPGRATLWSAVLEILAALYPAVLIALQFAGAGGRFGPVLPVWAGVLAAAVLIEGLVRLIIAVSSSEPVGCLLLALLGLRLKAEPREDIMSDEYSGAGEFLNVNSPTRKAWWERAGGVTYRGEPFKLEGSEKVGTFIVYRFRKGGSGYPEADPARERDRNISSDRSFALAPFWGFLPARDQRAVEFFGRYRSRPYVLLSIAFNFLLSASMILTDAGRIGLGYFGWWIGLRLIFAATLLGESVFRLLRHLSRGEISGSFLGVFVKPIYYMAVRGGLDETAPR